MHLRKEASESDVLDRVRLCLVADEQAGQFNYYLEKEHYLESGALVGEWMGNGSRC